MAGNEVEWSSEQMIENANSWSLAGDVALLNRLKKFSESLLSETEVISANVDNLLNNLENISLKLDLTKNEFQSLRNTQFIENRVYEDDETLENEENKKEEKELTEQEKESAIKETIVKGLKVMEKYFEKIEVAMSDSEEENIKSYILQPKDPYADRPLPYLVGSQDWYKKWHVGLLPSESESESEKEEEVYSSSDSDEGLPKDRNLLSETSSELDLTNRHTGPVANSTFNDSQDRRREIFHSSDESSDQSNSLPVTAPISNQNFAEQLAAKLGDVISGSSDNSQHINRNPIKKMNQATKYGNLFSDQPPPLDDLEDTVLPKSAQEGLFSGGRDLFGESTEDELFWDQPIKTSQNIKNTEQKTDLHSDVKPNLKVSKGLFDESDSSSEDDMFTKAEKRKVKITQPYLQPFKTTVPFVDDQPPQIVSKKDTASSKKKPVGGVSIFGENSNIFNESSKKPSFENTKSTEKKPLKKTSLFDESSDEDITPKKNTLAQPPRSQQTVKKLSLFDDRDDIAASKTQNTLKKPEEKKNLSLFDDDNISIEKEYVESLEEKTKKPGLFNEKTYQNVDLFRPTTKEISEKTENLNNTNLDNKKQVKKISLFDDDDDFLKEEDIFSSVSKKKSLFDDIDIEPKKTHGKGLFGDTESDTSSKISANKDQEKLSKGLFDDLEPKHDVAEILSTTFKIKGNKEKRIDEDTQRLSEEVLEKKSPKGLFDELETSGSSEDLFGSAKHQSPRSKEGSNKKKITGDLFKDIDSSTSITSSIEDSKTEIIDVKSKEKTENMFEETENFKKDLSQGSEVGENTNDYLEKRFGDSTKSIFENKKGSVKPKGASFFQGGADEGFYGNIDNKDIEEKSAKLIDETPESSILKVQNFKDKNNLAEKTNPDILNEKEPTKEGDREEETFKNVEAIDNIRNQESTIGKPDDVSKQSKNDLIEKIKNVSFLDSNGESSLDDDFGFGKKTTEHEDNVLHKKRSAEGTGSDFKENIMFKPEEQQDVKNLAEPSNITTEKLENNMYIPESPPKHVESLHSNAPKNFTIPPPIDLFDPTPPPLDWDVASDHSGESDTFSLTDGILNHTNLNQSQARSSLFDEAPPSLDANDSSGIVRDLNVTRVETDDSSFYPYASSSRRLSSDIFGEQQSQDSFFVTKNRTELSTQQGSSLEQIPEIVENVSSKIENLTPSGILEDFEESSVFEGSKNGSEDSENMNTTTSASEIKNKKKLSLFEDKAKDSQSANTAAFETLDNLKERAILFEENRDLDKEKSVEKDEANEKPYTSQIKTSPGKLQHNLKINVGALMPGAARPKIRLAAAVAKSRSSDEIDKSDRSIGSPTGEANLGPPILRRVVPSKGENIDENFEALSQTEVLHSATKDRVRIPIKRKPSTRRARQEAVRKSMTDFTLNQNEENPSPENEQSLENNKISHSSTSNNEQSSQYDEMSQRLASNDKGKFLKDLNYKLRIPDDVPKRDSVRAGDEKPEVKGVSLVFNERDGKQIAFKEKENSVSKDLSVSLSRKADDKLPSSEVLEKEDKANIFSSKYVGSKSIGVLEPDSTSRILEKEELKPESKHIFEDSYEENSDIFKATSKASNSSRKPKKDINLFGDEESNSSDEDLFSSTKKSFRKDLVLSIDKPLKVEEFPSKKDSKPSVFSNKSDSESDELFGDKLTEKKIVGERSKKANIFNDSEDSSEEDLFGPKSSKGRSGNGDFGGNTGSIIGTKRMESKNVMIAGVKKLENKEVTDFDPLSALK